MSGENQQGENQTVEESAARQLKSKPIKVLPTDRLGFEKQLAVLRGYVAASGAEKKAVSNKEVGAMVSIHDGTISNCNPFLHDIGLLERDGQRYRPSDAVISYANSYDWDAATGALKLAPVISATWFATTLLPRLNFKALSKDEAVTVLADAARATKDYKPQIELLIDYLRVAGLITVENNIVTAAAKSRIPEFESGKQEGNQKRSQNQNENQDMPPGDVERFIIPIPGKPSAVITVPKDLTPDDWEMLQVMLKAYIKRLQGLPQQNASGGSA